MWTRAAVALRNINICEMPSRDDYLGVGRRAGCAGRVCSTTASPSQYARARRESSGSRMPSPVTWVPGLSAPGPGSLGIVGRTLRSFQHGANCMYVAMCFCDPNRDVGHEFDPRPFSLLVTCGPFLCIPLC